MDLQDRDHEPHVERAIELARTAAERGDDPFGTVLVRAGTNVMEGENRVATENDVALHPELTLARRAAREISAEDRAETVMYTSTEPCPMCAAGVAFAGLGGVVYSVAGASAADVAGGTQDLPCDEVFDRLGADIPVVGGVLEEEGLAVLREHL